MEDHLFAKVQQSTDCLDDAGDPRRSDDEQSNVDERHNVQTPVSTFREGPQTGPKGVIADHAEYERARWQEQQRARAEYNARMLAKAPTTTTYAQDEAEKAKNVQQQDELVLEYSQRGGSDDDDDEDDMLLQDEEIMQRYREQRLQELKQLSNQKARQQHRLFGTVQDVSADEYVAAIDKEWRTVPVVVHIYDERIHQCQKLDEFLDGLAEKYALAKFIRVSAQDLDFDLVGSPAILIYKSGMLVGNYVRLIDLVGPVFSIDAVEKVLLRSGAISSDDSLSIPSRVKDQNDDD